MPDSNVAVKDAARCQTSLFSCDVDYKHASDQISSFRKDIGRHLEGLEKKTGRAYA